MRTLHKRPIAVTGSRDGTVRVWDVQHGRAEKIFQGHTGSVRCLDVNGNRVVSGSYDTTCRVSMVTGLQVVSFNSRLLDMGCGYGGVHPCPPRALSSSVRRHL